MYIAFHTLYCYDDYNTVDNTVDDKSRFATLRCLVMLWFVGTVADKTDSLLHYFVWSRKPVGYDSVTSGRLISR